MRLVGSIRTRRIGNSVQNTNNAMEQLSYNDKCAILRSIKKRLTDWDDIKIGDVLHIPPLMVFDRRTFTVSGKDKNYLTGTMVSDKYKTPYFTTLYKSEISALYAVKAWNLTNINVR